MMHAHEQDGGDDRCLLLGFKEIVTSFLFPNKCILESQRLFLFFMKGIYRWYFLSVANTAHTVGGRVCRAPCFSSQTTHLMIAMLCSNFEFVSFTSQMLYFLFVWKEQTFFSFFAGTTRRNRDYNKI